MAPYRYRKKTIPDYLQEVYVNGLKKSRFLTDRQVEKILSDIGIFRFKGYLYAFRPDIQNHSIDDVLTIYYFDKFLTRYIMELTSTVETMLKTRLVELCYNKTDNPFFYLMRQNHKYGGFQINKPSLDNWRNRPHHESNDPENYLHYSLYYKAKYRFKDNRRYYLQNAILIEIHEDVNYPPFHYLVENATLGVVIYMVKSLKIGNYDLLRAIGHSFGVKNPKTFKPYLERLNEVRNRAAHRERLFNRSFRSVKGVGRFDAFRKDIEPHRFVDVYLYLYFMLGRLPRYLDYLAFQTMEIEALLDDFQNDRMIAADCLGLNTRLNRKMREFVLRNMGA
jgi:abortive infection bacteriophage resistance protein